MARITIGLSGASPTAADIVYVGIPDNSAGFPTAGTSAGVYPFLGGGPFTVNLNPFIATMFIM